MSLSRKVCSVAILLLLLPASFFLIMWEQGNFHEITKGEAYRSAQLDRDQFEYYIDKYHIKSILNLRGQNSGEEWYQEELKVAVNRHLVHYDIPLSATSEPSSEDVQKLLAIFREAPRPVLIHCKAGADRSGLVGAMWKVVVDKEPKSEASKQLFILYGHLPIGETSAMDRFFERWATALP
ncbi:MAG TPA: protein tyrosine phosphatase [Nitrospiraceae bacterium]|jgi:undecaprenyl-diphosphatase|nr:protein tyrosine phosphatase [Nitrospiraceae bacterium]